MIFHTLLAHPSTPLPQSITIKMGLGLESSTLRFHCIIYPNDWPSFDLDSINVERKDQLWEDNCLECFVKNQSKDEYYELNLSLNGEWNFFHFDDYRKNRLESLVNKAQFERTDKGQLEIDFSLDSETFKEMNKEELKFHLSSMLYLDGSPFYLATHHPPGPADFHHPENFTLGL